MVKDPSDETSVYVATNGELTCNWGEKLINAWKADAKKCSVFE